ncbi:MAG: serine/threonine-protein kinase [Myxococcota bacterium]
MSQRDDDADARALLGSAPVIDALDRHAARAEVMRRMFGAQTKARELGRFEVRGRIGAGSMGNVYRAFDPELGRMAAIKTIADGRLAPRHRERVLTEARSLAQLSHPNVVTIYDVMVIDEQVLLVMELVDGTTLREWFHQARPDAVAVLDALGQAARGVAAAHAAGIVHGDLKPENLLRSEDGRVRVADFGLARSTDGLPEVETPLPAEPRADAEASATPATWRGSPTYLAPAQLRGEMPDASSDQYALCVTVFEGLYGRRPHPDPSSDDEQGWIEARQRPLAQPAEGPSLGAAQWRAVARGLEPDPRRRHSSVLALAEALTRTPSSWRGWAAVTGVGALAMLGVAMAPVAPEPPACEEGATALERVWTASARSRVASALAGDAPSVEPAAVAFLDDWAGQWSSAYVEACTLAPSDAETFDRTMGCLRGHRHEFEAAVQVLAEADLAAARRGATVVEALGAPKRCSSDADAPEPYPEALAGPMASAWALFRAGRDADARRAVDALPIDRGGSRAEAESMLLRALLDTTGGDAASASDGLERAFGVAKANRHDDLALRAAIKLVRVNAHELAEIDAARGWLEHARALATGRERDVEVELRTVSGVLELAAGNPGEAREHFEAALAEHRAGDGGDWTEAYLLERLGVLAKEQGRYEDAVGLHQRAIELRRRLVHAGHPDLGESIFNLGTAQQALGQTEQARRSLSEARTILEQALGAEHPLLGTVFNNLGMLEGGAGDDAAALKHFERALAVVQAGAERDSPVAATILLNSGLALLALQRPDEARARMTRALRLLEDRLGPDHVEVAFAAHGLGKLEMDTGRVEQALPLLDRALNIATTAAGPEHPIVVEFQRDRDAAAEALERD